MSAWHSRPRTWAIGAAAVAVMVCGAVWPQLVVGAGGALVAAVALAHGIRAFRTERRPDPSGPDPDGVRTDPDADGEQPADQAGHDPDALRTRIAAAIRASTCQGDCDDSEDECHDQRMQGMVWHFGQLAEVSGTPEQIADAVLPLIAVERATAARVRTAIRYAAAGSTCIVAAGLASLLVDGMTAKWTAWTGAALGTAVVLGVIAGLRRPLPTEGSSR